MGKQYKELKEKDIVFINEQKLFYLASCSNNEVNLSPKGYESIKVLDSKTLLFLSYPGSGNRTYRDAMNDGEFTLVFNAFSGDAKILRIFCKASVVESKSKEFYEYLEFFDERESIVRNFFKFKIYAVESSCGESVPFMEFKSSRESLKNWAVKMDKKDKLEKYKKDHLSPVDLKKI